MKRIVTTLILIFCMCHTYGKTEIDSLVVKLEFIMTKRAVYDQQKKDYILQIKNFKKNKDLSKSQAYFINSQLIKEYESFVFDSALLYLDKNLEISKELKNNCLLNETKLSLAKLLSVSGRLNESFDILKTIDKKSIPKKLLINYYLISKSNYFISLYYSKVKSNGDFYYNEYIKATDEILTLSDSTSEEYLAINESKLRNAKQFMECLKINDKRLMHINNNSHLYSLITFERAITYQAMGDIINYRKYLIMSAMADIENSVKENASLTALAISIYEDGQIEKAHNYINFAFEDAIFFNSTLRFTQISNVLPIINESYNIKSNKQKRISQILFIVISLLSLGLLTMVFLLLIQMRRLKKTRNDLESVNSELKMLNFELNNANNKLHDTYSELQEANKVKEYYIGNLLLNCANYINKLDVYRKMVNNYIVNKKIEELFRITKSKQLIEQEVEEYYKNFDSVFLHIFPNFVLKMNDLLKEEEVIILKADEKLNTELRIFALIRLGINDSIQIAELLNYSVRTIYNYRVKIKNKAKVPRDEFEDYVQKIGAFSK